MSDTATKDATALPVPEPGLTPAEVIRRAEALRPRLLEEQAATEERTFYSEEMHQAFSDAGFYRILQPRMFGGYEFDVPTFYRVIIEVYARMSVLGLVPVAQCRARAAGRCLLLRARPA